MSRRFLTVLWALAVLSAAPPARAADMVGGLFVSTTPAGAEIYINGELRGVSPCGMADIPLGEAEVTARMQGYAPSSGKVRVRGGRTARVRLRLQKLKKVGSLIVLIDPPGARIAVDRVPAGRTPVVVRNVSAGSHRVTVSAEGYRPRHAEVTVVAGRRRVLKGRLQRTPGNAPEEPPSEDRPAGADLRPEQAPLPGDLPDEAALQAATAAARARDYAAALGRLEGMARDEDASEHARAVARDRRVLAKVAGLVGAAVEVLRSREGEDAALSLHGGLPVEGTICGVSDEEVVLATARREVNIPLKRLDAEQIVKLASERYDPGEAGSHTRFALFYACDGRFEKAYEELRRAERMGAEIESALSYVRARHLWAAAVERAGTSAALAARAVLSEEAPGAPERPVRVLVDLRHGTAAPRLRQAPGGAGFRAERLDGLIEAGRLEEGDVLFVREADGGQHASWDRREVQAVLDFVRSGGGLVVIAARRPEEAPGSGSPLLRWLGVRIGREGLALSDEAPDGYPAERFVAYPTRPTHPVVAGVRRALFPRSAPALEVGGAARPVLVADRFVLTGEEGESGVVLGAAGVYGKGRFVVFAGAALAGEKVLVRNAVSWAAGGAER